MTKEQQHTVLPQHYITPTRFMDLMQHEVMIKDQQDIGGMVGHMLRQDPQPEYVANESPDTLHTYDQAKIRAREKAFRVDATVDGFISEYGVDDGTSFMQLCGLTDQKVYGFDAFEGLADGGKWRGAPIHQDQFQHGGEIPFTVPGNGVITKGWFDDKLPGFDYGHNQAKFMNIDCDNYKATRTVLDTVQQYIKTGTVIALDDYFNEYKYKGETQFTAWQDFVTSHRIRYEYLYCVAPAVIVKIL